MKFSVINAGETCLRCGRQFKNKKGLHGHISRACGGLESYYHEFFPKHDPWTKKPLKFKTADDYSKKFFESYSNEYKWCRAHPHLACDWYEFKIEHLLRRPHHQFQYSLVEWASNKNVPFGELECILEIIQKTNLKPRFSYGAVPVFENLISADDVLVDTREQKPLFENEKMKISAGDYTLRPELYNAMHIDRKSLSDFIGTFTNGYERFERELELASALGIYLVVLVEAPFRECLDYMPPRRRKQVVTGRNAFFNVRMAMQKFGDIQFLFVKNRDEARKWAMRILSNPENTKKHDLQYIYGLE